MDLDITRATHPVEFEQLRSAAHEVLNGLPAYPRVMVRWLQDSDELLRSFVIHCKGSIDYLEGILAAIAGGCNSAAAAAAAVTVPTRAAGVAVASSAAFDRTAPWRAAAAAVDMTAPWRAAGVAGASSAAASAAAVTLLPRAGVVSASGAAGMGAAGNSIAAPYPTSVWNEESLAATLAASARPEDVQKAASKLVAIGARYRHGIRENQQIVATVPFHPLHHPYKRLAALRASFGTNWYRNIPDEAFVAAMLEERRRDGRKRWTVRVLPDHDVIVHFHERH